MVRNAKIDCSPYLLMERRSLREACWQIAERHGRVTLPCGACDLADFCAADGPPKRAALSRSGRPAAACALASLRRATARRS